MLAPEQINDVAMALMALTHEVWLVNDRVRVLEAVLAKHGIDAAAEIDAFTPDADLQKTLSTQSQALVSRIVGALMGEAPKNPTGPDS
jgi:hypothetical protein